MKENTRQTDRHWNKKSKQTFEHVLCLAWIWVYVDARWLKEVKWDGGGGAGM